MRWLFFLMVFDTAGGDLAPKVRMNAVYATEQECNALGEEIAGRLDYKDPNLRSFSICIPESSFKEPVGKLDIERLDE
jgi:hypothetical protein